MDQECHDDKPMGRHRSPIFCKDETQALVNFIANYKNIVNSKSTSSSTLHAKEIAWAKITKMFNSQGFKHYRNVDSLKIKWFNLKKEARKISKNLMDEQHSDCDELTSQVVAMVCQGDNSNEILIPKELEDKLIDLESEEQKQTNNDSVQNNEEYSDKKEKSTDRASLQNKNLDEYKARYYRKRVARSMNFTPQECRLLLQCVRPEKRFVFNKDCSSRAIAFKHRAWSRIANNFNKRNAQKRSVTELWNKMKNMKKLAKKNVFISEENKQRDCSDYTKLENEEDETQKIKSEPDFTMDDEIDQDDGEISDAEDDDAASTSEHNGDKGFEELRHNISDPLSTIFNGDSGIGSINMDSENSEVTKMKLELLRYQLENAKLERTRIENATYAENKLNEARLTETALRLRAARLEAVAAAMKLAPAHPALLYTPEEMPAQNYMNQYHQI